MYRFILFLTSMLLNPVLGLLLPLNYSSLTPDSKFTSLNRHLANKTLTKPLLMDDWPEIPFITQIRDNVSVEVYSLDKRLPMSEEPELLEDLEYMELEIEGEGTLDDPADHFFYQAGWSRVAFFQGDFVHITKRLALEILDIIAGFTFLYGPREFEATLRQDDHNVTRFGIHFNDWRPG